MVGRFAALVGLSLLLALVALACKRAETSTYVFEGPTMGTTFTVKVVAESLGEDDEARLQDLIERELESIDQKMSHYLEDSELSRFNRSRDTTPFTVSPETLEVFRHAQELSALTGGAFDITAGILVNAWGFGPDERGDTPPSEEEIARARERSGYRKLELDPQGITIRKTEPFLEYDALPGSAEDPTPLHIMRGLQAAAEGEMMWLGKVPPKALIEMRRQGAGGEIRSLLRQGITQLVNANPGDFIKTSDKVVGNLRKAFEDHQENVKELSKKKWSFAGRDISKWLVFGTLEIASAISTYEAFGLPLPGLASWAGNQVTDVPKLKDITEKAKALHQEGKILRRSPIGVLFKYRK